MLNRTLLLATAFVALGYTTIAQAKQETFQGVGVQFSGVNDLAIAVDKVYQFDVTQASAYYTNELNVDKEVVITCQGVPSDCAISNRPVGAVAPSPLASEVESIVNSQQCVFLDGGNLISETEYVQVVNRFGASGRGRFAYTYPYIIKSTQPSVPAFTAWNQVSGPSDGSSREITIGATITSEFARRNHANKLRYAFNLRAKGASLISNLKLLLNGTEIASPSVTIEENCPGCQPNQTGAVDFIHVNNAGTQGSASLAKEGNARDILNSDDFPVNDDGSERGRRLARGIMSPVTTTITPGSYNVSLTGTVRALDIEANTNFTYSQTLNVVAPGCSSAP